MTVDRASAAVPGAGDRVPPLRHQSVLVRFAPADLDVDVSKVRVRGLRGDAPGEAEDLLLPKEVIAADGQGRKVEGGK